MIFVIIRKIKPMKILFSFLTILILNKECNQKKTMNASNEATTTENSSQMIQEDTKVSYEASTRGFYEKIWVGRDSITVTSDRDHKINMRYPTSEKDWDELMTLLKDVNIKEMPNLESPTKMRLYDGAAHASLTVGKAESEIRSNSFDHGHPPKAIEAVVNKVLSIKEKCEKN
jgi:hypothetical protein